MTGRRQQASIGNHAEDPGEPTPRHLGFKRGRKPHNAPPPPEFESLQDLVKKVGSEIRKASLKGETVEMSRTERTLRLQVDRALSGKTRDLVQILRLMQRHPNITKSYKERTVITVSGLMVGI